MIQSDDWEFNSYESTEHSEQVRSESLFVWVLHYDCYYKGYSACERDLTFKLQGAMIEKQQSDY